MGRPAKKFKKRQDTHRVKDPVDFHLDAAGKVNRRLVSDAVWDKMVDHYRQFPGDHMGAHKAADVTYNTARNAWEKGHVRRPDRPAIKELIAREMVDMRGELVDLRRLTTQDRALREKKAKDDIGDDRALESRLLRVARGNAVAALAVGNGQLRMALSLTQRLSDLLDNPAHQFTPKELIRMVSQIVRLNHAATESAGITSRMSRDMLGGPEVLVQVANMGTDEAVKTIEDGHRTLRRLRERMVASSGKGAQQVIQVLDTVVVDPDPLEIDDDDDLDEDLEPLRYPPPTAQALKLAVSGNLHGACYEELSQTLWVTFSSGATYRYEGVPKAVTDEWESAPSAGKYFAAQVKTAFNYDKVS